MRSNKFLLIIALVALLILGYGGSNWLAALAYQPAILQDLPLRAYKYPVPPNKTLLLKDYQRLLTGKAFFPRAQLAPEETLPAAALTIAPPKALFITKLVLWGITKGKFNRAIVGISDDSKGQTWIVKVGDKVNQEEIIKIGSDYIVVRNKTGEGKVVL